jgi:hypothetical protein
MRLTVAGSEKDCWFGVSVGVWDFGKARCAEAGNRYHVSRSSRRLSLKLECVAFLRGRKMYAG